MQKWYLILVLSFGGMLVGCLGDEVGVETKPQIILQPPYVRFEARGTSDLIAKWGRSLTDTQQNFKGYYIELFTSVKVDPTSELDSILDTVATAHAPKSDTSYKFTNILPGRYTLSVWGERYPDPANPDSLVLSAFPVQFSFTFDLLPVLAPKGLLAHANGLGNVTIYWEPSSSIAQEGMAGYIIRYRDSSSTSSKIYTFAERPPKSVSPITRILQFPLASDGLERPYKIWVKGVRNDSTESVDSAVIVWSGATAVGLNQPTVEIGKKIFIGKVNTGYEIKQLDAAEAQIAVTATDSTVTIEALGGARFASRVDDNILDSVFFSAPFAESDFTETTLTLPRNPARSGVCFYVRLPGEEGTYPRARIMFVRNANGTLIHPPGTTIRAQAKFQLGGPPYNLPYF